jgi:hypothetical protein
MFPGKKTQSKQYQQSKACLQPAKVDFSRVLCHNLFVSAPSPITDRDVLTGQLNAEKHPYQIHCHPST